MASHELIDAYVARLAERLPADTVDELADGLVETWQHFVAGGLAPAPAARAAIAEFGAPRRIEDEFVAQASGRRTARLLLATGPIMGVCWGTSLVTAEVWTWPIPRPVGIVFAVALFGVVALLLMAATTRHSYRRTRFGAAGGLAIAVLDAAMIAAIATLAPTLVWPMAIATAASLARISFAIRWLPKALND
jgi:hypothetical protein